MKFIVISLLVALICLAANTAAFNAITKSVIAQIAVNVLQDLDPLKDNNQSPTKLEQLYDLLRTGHYGFFDNKSLKNLPEVMTLLEQYQGNSAMFQDFNYVKIPYVYDSIAPNVRYPGIPQGQAASLLAETVVLNNNATAGTRLWGKSENTFWSLHLAPQLQSVFNTIEFWSGAFSDDSGRKFPIYYNPAKWIDNVKMMNEENNDNQIDDQQQENKDTSLTQPTKIYTNIHDLYQDGFGETFASTTKLTYATDVHKGLTKAQLKAIQIEAQHLMEMFPIDVFNQTEFQLPQNYTKTFLKSYFREWSYRTYLDGVKVYQMVLQNPIVNYTAEGLTEQQFVQEMQGLTEEQLKDQPDRREIYPENIKYWKYLYMKAMVFSGYRLAHIIMRADMSIPADETNLFPMDGISEYFRASFLGLVLLIALLLFIIVKLCLATQKVKKTIQSSQFGTLAENEPSAYHKL